MLLHDFLHYGQAQAAAALGAGPGFVDAIEAFEDALLVRLGDSDAVVLDLDNYLRVVGTGGYFHFAAGAVIFDGVIGKVDKDLL